MTVRIGTLVKTPSPQIVEVLALSGLDLLVVDAEHAPFGRAELDLMMLASRAVTTPLFVRVPDDTSATLLQTLDLAPAGVIIPHVDTADQAARIVRRCRFADGERSFSNAARFGRYGATTLEEAIVAGDRTEILCQIESPTAVGSVEAIAATPGVSGVLVGRADLALSLGLRSLQAEAVVAGARAALGAARRHGKVAGMVIGQGSEIQAWQDEGADFFLVGTDLDDGLRGTVHGRRPQCARPR